ncbi:MAG: hypothetical protein HOO67_07525 [Candidatus Peribacteraceae bacterium]|nr:hypothetical protein [Candidatus Peribacteraceae bacterium]
MKNSLRVLLGIVTLLTVTNAVACVGGQQWTKDVGEYTVDVTDDSVTIEPGQTVHFDFGLFTHETDDYGAPLIADFSTVDVAFLHGEEVVMQKRLAATEDRELTGFDYVFPDENTDYTLAVIYKNGDTELAAAAFPVLVGSGDASFPDGALSGLALLGLLVIGGVTMGAIRKKTPVRARRK